MKKKEVGLRQQRKLKGFEFSTRQAHRQSDMPKCHHLPKRKKEEKKEKEANFHKFSERTLGVFVVVLYMTTKKEQKENVQEKGLTRIRTGVTRSFSISVHCRTFSKSGMLTTTS